MSDEDIQNMILEIDEIQFSRAERLKKKYSLITEKLKGKKVVFLGDSITSDNLGYRVTVTKAANLYSFDGSVSGGTSSMILHTAKVLIEKQKPDLVSLMVGSNDSVSIARKELNQVSIEEYDRNVREIVRWAKEVGAKVLLFEIPPIIEELFEKNFNSQSKFQSNKNIQIYNSVLKKIAEDNETELSLNHWLSEKVEYFEPDGIHLNVRGQETFAEKWFESVTKTI